MHSTNETELMCARSVAEKAVPTDWRAHAPTSFEIRHVYAALRTEFGFEKQKAARRILRALGRSGRGDELNPAMTEALAWAACS